MFYRLFLLTIVCLSVAFLPGRLTAAIVDITGNQYIDSATIRSYVTELETKTNPTSLDIESAIQSMMTSGAFEDVKIIRNGNRLQILIKENPLIRKIFFKGQDRLEEKELRQEITLKEGDFLSKKDLQLSIDRLIAIYKRLGRTQVVINIEQNVLDNGYHDVTFLIEEGSVSYIDKIAFIGNKDFSDSDLRGLLASKEEAWWRILSSSTTFDQDRMLLDQEKLREFYRSEGYLDFGITHADAAVDNAGHFIITYVLQEGHPYHYDKISFNNTLSKDISFLEDEVDIETGDRVDVNALEVLQEALQYKLVERLGSGYQLDYGLQPIVKDQKHLADLNFVIQRQAPIYIERINIIGNKRTEEQVIRRELTFSEGDVINPVLIRASKRNLRGLGFFENVEFEQVPGSSDNHVIMNIAIKEQSTGEVSFGIGYSTTDAIIGEASISERNFLGKGLYVRLGTLLSGRREQFNFSFTEPYLYDRRVSAGFDVFHSTSDYQIESSYDEVNTGLVLRSGFKIDKYLKFSPRYQISANEIINVRNNRSLIVRDTERRGRLISSLVGYELAYDRRDDILEPTDGYFLSLNQDFMGLGGDVFAWRNTGRGVYYHSLYPGFVWSTELEGGSVIGLGNYNLRIVDRYLMGANSFRGFEFAGIGPRFIPAAGYSRLNDDAIGGSYFVISRNEISFPLYGLEDLGMQGATFSDIGTLWHVDNVPNLRNSNGNLTGRIRDDTSIRASIGVGVKWRSPIGPIRLDFAKAVLKEEYDRTEVFRFSAGSRF